VADTDTDRDADTARANERRREGDDRRQRAAGQRQRAAGQRQRAAGRRQAAGGGQPEAADRRRPAGAGQPDAADRPQPAGAGQPEAADRRQQILDAALAIADEQGLNAVTMRAVAARIGVTAMALYPHVRSKDDLLDGLVDRLLGELSRLDLAQPWPDRLRALGRSAREVAQRHPGVVPLLFARPAITPGAVLVVEAIYQALLDAGVPDSEVARVERLLSTVVLGYAISETGGRFAERDPRLRRALLEGVDLPAHRRLATQLAPATSWDAEFETDLDDLVKLVQSVAVRPGAGRP
jgi:AcrR family transcriptional regulator